MATGWLAGRMEGQKGWRTWMFQNREAQESNGSFAPATASRGNGRSLRSKALKTAGPARRDATCNVKRARVDGDVGAAVAAGKALEGMAPEGKHLAPIRYRSWRGNPVNPMVGFRMQQA